MWGWGVGGTAQGAQRGGMTWTAGLMVTNESCLDKLLNVEKNVLKLDRKLVILFGH